MYNNIIASMPFQWSEDFAKKAKSSQRKDWHCLGFAAPSWPP